MDKGVLTTCDLSEPHYHLAVNKLEIYPGNKMVIRGVRFYEGSCRCFIGLIWFFLSMDAMMISILLCRKSAIMPGMDIISRTVITTISVQMLMELCFMITIPAKV